MLKIVSDCVNIPLFDDHGNTKEFIEYMNSNSMFPITYKLQGSTQSREFYRYYPCNIDTTITDLNRDDGEKSGTVMDHYNITFTVKAEYISTGFYFIFSDRLYDIHFPEIHAEDTDIIPIFTDVIQREDLNLRDGWQLYNRGSCRLEDPNDTIDQIWTVNVKPL